MIHYSCDLCKRELDPEQDVRYVVKMEVAQEIEPLADGEGEDDRDYLEEIQSVLEQLDDEADIDLTDGAPKQMRFDLCPRCAKAFLKSPLGRDLSKQLDFSKN